MRLTPMRYKEFIWPHNPETYQVEYRRAVSAHKVPFGGYALQDLGKTYRIFRGEGTFSGEGAYETFRALERVFEQDGAGLLTHPVWPASNARFVMLRLTEEPMPDHVRYAFTFWEDQEEYPAKLTAVRQETAAGTAAVGKVEAPSETAVYIVKKGDTLWGIAERYGVTLRALIKANPGIKNPNLIYPGDRVNIP